MIGHYLLTLTPEQEDRILTRPMEGYRDGDPGENLCLLEIIGGGYDRFYQEDHPGIIEWRDFLCERVQEEIVAKWSAWKGWEPGIREKPSPFPPAVYGQYDYLYKRFGERANAAIRNRILANRARRELLKANELAEVSS
jgi:hypothetical protein